MQIELGNSEGEKARVSATRRGSARFQGTRDTRLSTISDEIQSSNVYYGSAHLYVAMRLLNVRPTQYSDPSLRSVQPSAPPCIRRCVYSVRRRDCIREGAGPLSVSYLGTAKINEQFAENGGFECRLSKTLCLTRCFTVVRADADIECLLIMMLG